MRTYKINKKDLKNEKILSIGYKMFNNDWSTRKGNYCYADENGKVLNTIHRVDGTISECNWGLHFSKNPIHCFNFYESVQWNKFAKVNAYEEIIESKSGDKTVAQALEIIEIYTFKEFIEEIKKFNGVLGSYGVHCSKGVICSDGVNWSKGVYGSKGVHGSNGVDSSKGVYCSDGVNRSEGVTCSDGVSCSDGVHGSYGVSDSNGVNGSYGVNCSDGVNCSNGVHWSNGVHGSNGVDGSNGVYCSNGVHCSKGVNCSDGVNWSDGVYDSKGVNCSDGVNGSYGISESEGVSRSIFCYNFTGNLSIFNTKVSEERFNEVMDKIKSFNWSPNFNNAFDLKEYKLQWFEINIPGICDLDNKTAWSKMPCEMVDYIKSLKEYNEKIYNKIIGNIGV